MNLQTLGWTSLFESQATGSPFRPARVLSQRAADRFLVHDDHTEHLTTIRGRLRENPPAVGDWVLIDGQGDHATIEQLLERRTSISRKRPGKAATDQVLAANIDRIVVVMSLNQDFSVERLERYLTLVWDSGATPIIVLSKCDLVDDLAPYLAQVESRALGFPIFPVSNRTRQGLDDFSHSLKPQETVVFLGSSGVGKSTLVNSLAGEELRKTSSIRDWDGKGAHTSSDRHLMQLASGVLLIDTPGIREVSVWGDGSGVDTTFAEIVELAAQCRFSDCTHQQEPSCAVLAAIEAKTLDPARLASYLKLQTELRHLNARVSPAAAQVKKAQTKELMRAQKQHNKRSRKTQSRTE